MTVRELTRLYLAWARSYYTKDGQPTGTLYNLSSACSYLNGSAGSVKAAAFGLRELRGVQQAMTQVPQLCRRSINDRIRWIRQMFRWAAEEGYVSDLLPSRLGVLRALAPGRCGCRENPGVGPVTWEAVSSTLAGCTGRSGRMLAVMIELQWWAGMRPSELVAMRACDLDRSGEIWLYTPASHKAQHFGKRRIIYLGPQAQSALSPWLKRCESLKRDAAARLFPISRNGYYTAVRRINQRLIDEDQLRGQIRGRGRGWFPNQLRHAAATRIRKAAGIEAARLILGHSAARTTEIYAEQDRAAALKIARELG